MSESKESTQKPEQKPVFDYTIRKEEKPIEIHRKEGLATIARIKSYDELSATTEEESYAKYLEKAKDVWGNLAVHGIIGKVKKKEKNEKGEKIVVERVMLTNHTDLDGKAAMGLLNLSGVDTTQIEYVKPGSYVPGKINLDTGGRYGFIVEDEGKTVFFDHHTPEGDSDTSATKMVYSVLTAPDLEHPSRKPRLERTEYLDKLVEFVTQIDNKTFPDEEKHFKGSMLTLLGLQRFVKFDTLLNFFKDGRSVTELLSPDDLEKYGLLNAAMRQKDIVESSSAILEEMEANGLIIESEQYGKIAVDIGKQLPGGFDAAKAYGCGGYVMWSPDTNGLFITTVKPLRENFSQGFKIRGSMWLKPRDDGSELTIPLSEILTKLAGSSFTRKGTLADYLLQEPITPQKPEQEKTDTFEPFIAKLRMKYADDEISEEELNFKTELVQKAADSEDPSQAVKNAFADDDISEEELTELLIQIKNRVKI